MRSRSSGRYSSTNAIANAPCNERSSKRIVVLYGLTLAALGCGVSGPASNQHALSPEVIHSEGRGPTVTQVPRTIVTPAFATNVEELFLNGQTYLRQGKP